jgi:HAD superfamily hydrolase (TIGR01490 family)
MLATEVLTPIFRYSSARQKPSAYIRFTMNTRTIAAFDFDGTITKSDTMFAFIRFVKGEMAFLMGMIALAPTLIQLKMGFLSAQIAKEALLTHFFAGMSETELYELGEKFCETELPQLIRPKAMEHILWHQEQNNPCFLVTASLTFWTKAWAEKNNFTLIATEPEIENGIFTGNIVGNNCNGQSKVNRLLAALELGEVYCAYGYGDSEGDRELLRWVDLPHYKPFR